MTLNKIWHNLQGQWQFKRNIIDHITNIISNVSGKAYFAPNSNLDLTLLYNETGIWQLNNLQLSINTQYLFEKGCHQILIYFLLPDTAKGNLFHSLQITAPLDLSSKIATGYHLCNLDEYHSAYEFININSFNITHVAKGPKKFYTSVTNYIRGIAAT
ncbi:DUF6314 family protein [Rickettsiales endosymbiont of Stachyamoeba lipophora]|uniref:DUF6314 family protein n=1 Tax=Rickettsiales endosymbiont of Stachyamoeba lipophora TaxID=2486578 RepID=UPI000F65077C|nr:DUF6314 family protein [Rickettsiales endosymbiont of Stachyamoeba lipophora]AZL15389.1 hypothetical protein EF513_02305 [Rickettsiales endosymbiont of Stachyamoeba lipophora]